MNRTYTDCNSSGEIPRYICIFFVKLKKIFFLCFFKKFFLFYFLLKFPTTPPLLLNFHFHIFLWFFSIRGKKFVFLFSFFFFFWFSSFFLFSFLSFLLLVFLSYFLLKSSNTPLLFLNFHFHFTITLQEKKERSPIFKLNFIYISKFGVFVFVFKYFISKSLTSTLNFLIFVYHYVI